MEIIWWYPTFYHNACCYFSVLHEIVPVSTQINEIIETDLNHTSFELLVKQTIIQDIMNSIRLTNFHTCESLESWYNDQQLLPNNLNNDYISKYKFLPMIYGNDLLLIC